MAQYIENELPEEFDSFKVLIVIRLVSAVSTNSICNIHRDTHLSELPWT